MERLKRPSSLSKALIPSSPTKNIPHYSTITIDRENKLQHQQTVGLKEYAQDYQDPIDCKKNTNYADPTLAVNVESFSIEDEFKRKVTIDLSKFLTFLIYERLINFNF